MAPLCYWIEILKNIYVEILTFKILQDEQIFKNERHMLHKEA